MDKITTPNGREVEGDIQLALDFANALRAAYSKMVVYFVGEDGAPCQVKDRVAMCFGPEKDSVNFDGMDDPFRVRLTERGRYEVKDRLGRNIAEIGNPGVKSYKNGAEFLTDFFNNAHKWPIGGAIFGQVAGHFFWNIFDPSFDGDPYGLLGMIEVSGTGISGVLTIPPITAASLYGTSIDNPLELENGLKIANAGGAVIVFLAGEPWAFDIPPEMFFTGDLNELNTVQLNTFPSGVTPGLWSGAGVNGMAQDDRGPIPAYVSPQGIVGPVYRWTPAKKFSLGVFE